MPKTATIRARVNPQLKKDAEAIFSKLGLTATDAISIFYSQVKLQQGLPFPVRIPNQTTRKTLEATDRGEDVLDFENAGELFAALGI
jgi:DNA-damage-inducible protein J